MKQGSLKFFCIGIFKILLCLLILLLPSFLGLASTQNRTDKLQPQKIIFPHRKPLNKSKPLRVRESVRRHNKDHRQFARQPEKSGGNAVATLTLKGTIDWLSTVKPASWHDENYLWENTPLSFEGCTMKFKDRWLLPETSHSWVLNTVSLKTMDEAAIFLERQSYDGVGVRLNTRGEQIERKSEDGSLSINVGTYYVNIGNEKVAKRVVKALAHAIRLCKSKEG